MQIDINHLSKAYGKAFYALNDVTLSLGNGMFGLLGPNGAGKSTLMRILVTLMKPTSGNITIDGKDIQKHRKATRKMIGYLPEDCHFF